MAAVTYVDSNNSEAPSDVARKRRVIDLGTSLQISN